jgi:hypothetical protein
VIARLRIAARRNCVVLAAALALLGGAVACTSPAPASAPTLPAVAALLARHGADVVHHDAKAFASDLSDSPSSRQFRARQQTSFAQLARVPLASWSYSIGSRTDARDAEQVATTRYGTPAIIVRVTLRYALRGFDPRPTSHDLWWTLVEQHGAARIAGDTDLAGAGGASWRGPWDFGPLAIVRGPAAIVLGHPGNVSLMRTVATTVASAVPAVTAVWGTGWTGKVAVLVPSSPAELTAEAGPSSTITSSVAAVAVTDGQDPTTGAVYGQRLIVNPRAFDTLSAVGRRIVVRHEITHIASAAATSDDSPRWVVEGFADYVGNLGTGQPPAVVAGELRAQVRRTGAPAALPTDADFESTAAAQAYEGAWLACRLIAARAGQAGLVRFYRLVGSTAGAPTDPVAAALRAVLHEASARFVAQWRAYVQAELS